MGTYTVRVMQKGGSTSLRDYSFSQVCELLRGVPREISAKFWEGNESIVNQDGDNLKLVDMEKLKLLLKGK